MVTAWCRLRFDGFEEDEVGGGAPSAAGLKAGCGD
jgi:hypothetical protein